MSAVTLAHGSGGVETFELIKRLIVGRVEEPLRRVGDGVGIDALDDGATIPLPTGEYLVITVDAYTVNPPFFPGGNIGTLAAAGSINDVLMMGGRPIAVLDSIVVEEGFPMSDLETIVQSFIEVLKSEGVALVGGDFKVMPRGQIDKIVIATVGVGMARRPIVDRPEPGDKIIVSDCVGDHGAVISLLQLGFTRRVEELERGLLRSDVRPLTKLMVPLLERYAPFITAARDPTRGGLGGVLNEWASRSGHLIVIDEAAIPVRESVRRYSEMLGVDPLYLASEGVAVLAVRSEVAEEVVDFMIDLGFENAKIVGEVKVSERLGGYVIARTAAGGYRVVEPPHGELVPRIC